MLNANCCGLCGRVIAPRELFSHLVIDHGWKKVSENADLMADSHDTFAAHQWSKLSKQHKNIKDVCLFQYENNWHITSNNGASVVALPSEKIALQWLDFYAKERGEQFYVQRVKRISSMLNKNFLSSAPLSSKATLSDSPSIIKRVITTSKSSANTGPVFCTQCGGDGGAGGRCWKCDGTGWAK
ncbi:hypothetical protein [Shewanella sp. 125m-1]